MEDAGKVDGHEDSSQERRDIACPSFSISFEDADSYFELNVETMTRTGSDDLFQFQTFDDAARLPVVEYPRETPADRLFVDGNIVPLQKINDVDANSSPPEKSKGAGDDVKTTEVRSAAAPTPLAGEETTRFREALHREKKQQLVVRTRRISLLSAAFRNGYFKDLIKIPAQKLRMTFKPREEKEEEEEDDDDDDASTVNSRNSSQATARSSGTFKRLWTPIYNWFTFKSSKRRKQQAKGKMVEIKGQGTMIGVLEDITVKRVSADARGELKGRMTKSAPSSPRHGRAVHRLRPEGHGNFDREDSIGHAILHCRRSNLNRKI